MFFCLSALTFMRIGVPGTLISAVSVLSFAVNAYTNTHGEKRHNES